MCGTVGEVVVSHRDRLCRFAFELVEHVLLKAGCKVVVCDQGADASEVGSAESELKDDLLAILTVFVASNNGRRAAANRRLRKARALSEAPASSSSAPGADQEPEVEAPSDSEPGEDA
jgi:predicted site-specific integrase-resolvase